MSLPKISFVKNNCFLNMDDIIVDGRKQEVSVPRWLFEMLPGDKKDVAYNTLKEIFIAGFQEGQKQKSNEIQKLLSALKNVQFYWTNQGGFMTTLKKICPDCKKKVVALWANVAGMRLVMYKNGSDYYEAKCPDCGWIWDVKK